ncbi:RNA polymerase sigma-70 factor (ECF subfamily) [Silvibacterium bohemicum]|uniref:RNA polymerase sigma-70 factor (ECF subfamily) n=1 Tax=Silvibacterium bohemicum TaxID=1577686 RepID=A0A841JNQ8_9BACT|nr:RNA polymerase sigma factor [Silvibacterium bohemicum]MBB6142996.1 RNA polymerase sigma-70 factor (ECF subfamily) [Silvibacterium bohemicum]
MSSEAAALFPDALASTSEVRGTVQGAAAISSDPPDNVRHNTYEASASTVIPITEISDEALLEQVCQGTREALGILFRRHARTVRNVAYRILRNEAEAEDLVQEIFIFIYRKAALFNVSGGTARSWIVQVTYHRAFDRRRHLITRHFYTSQEIDDAALNMADRRYEILFSEWSLEDVWGRDWAEKLRELLSPSQLSTIELYFFEGYTFDEIAGRLGQTLSNTYNHYYRGLEKLRKSAFARKLRSK